MQSSRTLYARTGRRTNTAHRTNRAKRKHLPLCEALEPRIALSTYWAPP